MGEAVLIEVARLTGRCFEKSVTRLQTKLGCNPPIDGAVTQLANRARFLADVLDVAYDYAKAGNNQDAISACDSKWLGYGYRRMQPEEFRSEMAGALLRDSRRQVVVLCKRQAVTEDVDVLVLVRGTQLTSLSDVTADLCIPLECLHTRTSRVIRTGALVRELVRRYGHQSVCLVGHSLGASIVSIIAREIYLEDRRAAVEAGQSAGREVEVHLFNLPFLPLEAILEEALARFEVEVALLNALVRFLRLNRVRKSVVGEIRHGIAGVLSNFDRAAAETEFNDLIDMAPFIYVNKYDMISKLFIDFFRHTSPTCRGRGISSFTAVIKKFRLGPTAFHLFPSARLIISDKGICTFQSHLLKNWTTDVLEDYHIKCEKYRDLERVPMV